jgi:hypothetical protein
MLRYISNYNLSFYTISFNRSDYERVREEFQLILSLFGWAIAVKKLLCVVSYKKIVALCELLKSYIFTVTSKNR